MSEQKSELFNAVAEACRPIAEGLKRPTDEIALAIGKAHNTIQAIPMNARDARPYAEGHVGDIVWSDLACARCSELENGSCRHRWTHAKRPETLFEIVDDSIFCKFFGLREGEKWPIFD